MSGGGNHIDDLLYPELSYTIIGILFDVYNEIGPGYRESHYENSVAHGFDIAGLKYKEQLPYTVTYRGKKTGRYFFDLLIENKIIVELKVGDYFSRRNIHQASEYLKASDLQLAILANFTSKGVKYKRIVNIIIN